MKSRAFLTKDYSISRILKGGWQLADGHSINPIDKEKAIEDMFAFAQSGITTFDFGDAYLGVEGLVGLFLKSYKKKFGAGKLNVIQAHTKFIPDLEALPTITKEYVEKGIDRSLKRLGVDCLDLVQFHFWDYEVPTYMQAALYLVDLQKKGKIKHLGVTNFDVFHLKELIDKGVPVVSNQVQYSVLDHRPEHGMVEFCQKHNIKLLCYGTAAGGFLSEKYLGLPEPKEPFENRSLVKYKLIIDDFGGYDLFQELLRCLDKISQKYGVSLTNVASNYVLQKPQVAGIIIGARSTDHLQDNLNAFSFKLGSTDLVSIGEIVKKSSGLQGDTYSLERVKGGKHAVIMKYNLNKETAEK